MPDSSASPHHGHARAYAALAGGVFAIGWSALFVRWSAVPGWTSAFWRMTIAQLVFVPWALGSRARQGAAAPPFTRDAVRAAIVAGVFFAADLAFFNTAVMVSSAANATLLGVNAPIFVALGAWLLYRERPTRRFWTGFALSARSGLPASVTLLLICLVIGTPLHGYPATSWLALTGLALITQVIGHL